jgi:hypothetical protein
MTGHHFEITFFSSSLLGLCSKIDLKKLQVWNGGVSDNVRLNLFMQFV